MKRSLFAPVLAASALISSQAAQAQQACVEEADLNDTIIYAVPIAYDAAMSSCADQYTSDGFMRSGGSEFADRFRTEQDAAWPGTRRLMQLFMDKRSGQEGGGEAAMNSLIELMPEEQLRPFLDGLLGQLIMAEIKPESCSDIEEVLELIAPLPVENVSGLLTLVARIAELDDPPICGAQAE